MSNQRYLDVIITIDGFQHREEEFVLKAMAIVSCFHHTQWTRTYDTTFLLKRPRTHLVTYHHQSARHGHPLLKSGAAQFSAPKHFFSALCAVQSHWLAEKQMPVPALRLWTKGVQNCRFLEAWLPRTIQIHNLEDIDCPPLTAFALPSDVVESKTLAKALALASWFQARPRLPLGSYLVSEGTSIYSYILDI